MIRVLFFLVILALLAPQFSLAQIKITVEDTARSKTKSADTLIYDVYRNLNYEYCLLYPAEMLKPQGERADRTGQEFASDGRRIILTSTIELNTGNLTIQQKQKLVAGSAEQGFSVEEQVQEDNWFTLDGQRNGRYFFQKTVLQKGVFKTFVLEFDRCSRGRLNEVIPTLSEAFPFCFGKPDA